MLHFLVSLCVALRLFYCSEHKKRLPEINQTALNLQLDNILNLLLNNIIVFICFSYYYIFLTHYIYYFSALLLHNTFLIRKIYLQSMA